MGILSLLLWTPAVGVLLLALIPGRNTFLIRLTANIIAALSLMLCGGILSRYDPDDANPQFTDYIPLNSDLSTAYALGVDGLSMPMLVLTSLLVSVSLLASTKIEHDVKGYHIGILLLELGLLGVFSAQDWGLFYIFWQLALIPLFFLINSWGGQRRHAASLRFALYAIGGSVFMLFSLLAIGQYDMPQGSPLMASMTHGLKDMPLTEQTWVLFGFLVGFGVNMALFPLHAWLPLAHAAAPGPLNILLSGLVLKIGAYGLLRAVALLPEAAQTLQPLLIFLGLSGIVYGSLLAWRQYELKAIVAYWSASQMAVILVSIGYLNETGINGAILQMSAHGLIVGSLFLLIALLHQRADARHVQGYGSLLGSMPKFALLLTLTLLAAMAMPGTAGFIAAIHVLIGGFQQWQGSMAFFMLAALITGAYLIRTLSLLCTGPSRPDRAELNDLRPSELTIAGLLVLSIILLGLLPAPWLRLSAATVAQIGHSVGKPAN